jgi:hypothetical protein
VTGRRSATLVVLAALLLIVAASEGEAKSGTSITACGQVVTTDAVLTMDLLCSGPGVIVGAPGITIDLKGFTLREEVAHPPSWSGVWATNRYDDLTVKNGVVRNFAIGVAAMGDHVRISDVIAAGNTQGIVVSGSSASITSVNAVGNRSWGIRVRGDAARITSSTAAGNDIGIGIEGDSASIGRSTVLGNGTFGIAVDGNDASLTRNRADGNGFAGGLSDLLGLGIEVTDFTTAPQGTNTARGNDNSEECDPFYLC